jgi:hypothetical protein
MTAEQFTKAALLLASWRMAPTKELQTLKLMALVLRNRVKAGWHGGDWLKVIERAGDASAYVLPAMVDESYPELGDPSVQRFLWEVDKVYEGTAEDKITGGGLWWCELNKVDRSWFLENICRKPDQHPRVSQAVNITLYA